MMIIGGFAVFAIFMLVGLSLALLGGEWFAERNAELKHQINDGLTPMDPQWTITGPGTFRIDDQ